MWRSLIRRLARPAVSVRCHEFASPDYSPQRHRNTEKTKTEKELGQENPIGEETTLCGDLCLSLFTRIVSLCLCG